MNITVSKAALARGLEIVSRAVSSRTVLPILQNVLLYTEMTNEGWRLKLAATNLEIGITTLIPVGMDTTEGATTVPAKLFTDLIKTLQGDTVRLDYEEQSKKLRIRSGRSNNTISCIDAEDFPTVPDMPEDVIDLPAPTLKQLIDWTGFAAAGEKANRPILQSVCWQFGNEKLTLAATDGFRLSKAVTNGLAGVQPTTSLIPAAALREVNRLLTDSVETVRFAASTNRNQVAFQVDDTTIVSQLIDGNFPMYEQIIPKSYSTRVVVGTRQLSAAIRQARLFQPDDTGCVYLTVTPPTDGLDFGEIEIVAEAAEGESRNSLEASVEGNPIQIAFNGEYVAEVLSAIKSEQVLIDFISPVSPGVFKPDDDGFVHVIMPKHINR